MSATNHQQFFKALPTVLLAGFVAGTLDIAAACTQFYLKTGKGPGTVLRYIASGVFGWNQANEGGSTMLAWGLLFHYIIAFGLTIFFFWFFPKIKWVQKNLIVTGLLYGIFAWIVTVLIIVPLSNTPPPAPFDIGKAVVAAIILMVCIGLPIAFIIGNYYLKNKKV